MGSRGNESVKIVTSIRTSIGIVYPTVEESTSLLASMRRASAVMLEIEEVAHRGALSLSLSVCLSGNVMNRTQPFYDDVKTPLRNQSFNSANRYNLDMIADAAQQEPITFFIRTTDKYSQKIDFSLQPNL